MKCYGRDAPLRELTWAELFFLPWCFFCCEKRVSWQWQGVILIKVTPRLRAHCLTLPTPSTLCSLQPCHLLRTSVLPAKTSADSRTASTPEAGEEFRKLLFFWFFFFSQIFVFSVGVYKYRLFIIKRRYFTHTIKRDSTVQSKAQSLGIVPFFQVHGFTGISLKNYWCKPSPTISPLIFREINKKAKKKIVSGQLKIFLLTT